MKTVGISTGCLYKKIYPGSIQSVELVKKSKAKAIELSCIQVAEIDKFEIKKDDINGFDYVSFHAPSAGLVYKNDKETIEVLKKIEKIYKETNYENRNYWLNAIH
jgi:hypothetical protein